MHEDGEAEHSLRGPSGAHRWRRCPGSVAFEAQFPDTAGRPAAEGTVFHEYAALCVEHGFDPHDFEFGVVHKVDGHEIEWTEEMADHMLAGLDWIREYVEPGDVVIVERRVDISPWVGKGEFGTSDVCIIKPKKRLIIVFDWKYGGMPVSPVENDQCYLYFLGCWNSFASEIFNDDPAGVEVLFKIEQPRAPGGGGEWWTTAEACLEEGVKIAEDAKATYDPAAPRIPGHVQCHFCKGAGRCPEQAKFLLDVFSMKFDDLDAFIEDELPPAFDDPEKFTTEHQAYIVLHWKTFKKFVDRVHALVLHKMKAGEDVPLIKLVTGRSPGRKYKEGVEDQVKKALIPKLGRGAWEPRKLISPAVAEKALGKKTYTQLLTGLVDPGQGKPTIVPKTDPREALTSFADKFDNLTGNDDEEE